MYIMTPAEKGLVSFLLNDLIEALDRGVSVTIYLNTKFIMRHSSPTFDEKHFSIKHPSLPVETIKIFKFFQTILKNNGLYGWVGVLFRLTG